MRLRDAPTTELSLEVEASPESIWEYVTDIELAARFSEEFQGAEWIDGPARPGATFRGRSRHPRIGEWETTSTIIACEPGRTFAWAVGDTSSPAAVWTFIIEQSEEASVLTYRMQLGPGPSGLRVAIERFPDREAEIIQRRIEEQLVQMQRVLDGIKALAEAG
ncbi:MAG: SRPBCC family protein [Acidimicrobiia bacterium]|nr:SRPBCC family protein [Acidimicrobiia bacterium]